jgi:hypothetical protein
MDHTINRRQAWWVLAINYEIIENDKQNMELLSLFVATKTHIT